MAVKDARHQMFRYRMSFFPTYWSNGTCVSVNEDHLFQDRSTLLSFLIGLIGQADRDEANIYRAPRER